MLKLSNLESIGKPVYKFHNLHSVDFDGVDDFIELGEPISYTQHTISTWVKPSDNNTNSTILDARDASGDGIRLMLTSSEIVQYQLNSSTIDSSSAISVDEWHHIVGTYDGTTQKLYVDGSLVSSATTSQTISVTTNAQIGARNFSTRALEFLGKIDELAIFDRALTADEVTAIFRIKYGANLVQNGNFDELGSELVTQPLNLSSNFQNNGGGIIVDNDTFTTAGGSLDGISSNSSFLVTGKTYKLIIAGNTTSSGFTIGNQVLSGNEYATGFGTHYFVASGDRLWIRQQTAGTTNITSFSIKQVDPNDRFALGTGWAINASGLVYTGTTNANAEQEGILTSGKVYKLTYNVVTSTIDGNVKLMSETVSGTVALQKSVGTHTQLITANGSNGTDFGIRITGNTTGTYIIDNLMIEQQKYVASNLKLNSGNYKSADPVIVSTKSVDFDGVEEHLDLGTQSATSSLTYSAWVKVTDTDASTILSYGNTLLRLGTATSIQFWSDVSEPQLSTSVSTLTNVWSHIVVTQTGQNVKIYLNGVQVNSTSSNPPVNTGANISSIGRYAQGDLWYFTGQIDDVGIFNVSLSSDQVIELYNQGVPSNLSTHSANANLIGYWKMGDGTLDEAPLIADQTNATLGSELVTNGDYSTDSDWNKLNGSTISGGVGKVIANGALSSTGNNWSLNQNVGMAIGKTYKITFRARQTVGTGNFQVGQGYKIGFNQTITSSFADYVFYIVAADWSGSVLTGSITIGGLTVNDEFEIDDVSVKQVNGNPALMQNTPTIVTDAPLTKIRNYYRMGDGILDKFPLICDMIEPSLQDNVLTGNSTTFDTGIGDWVTYNGGQLSHDNTLKALEVTLLSSESGARINTNDLISGGQTGKLIKVSADIWRGTTTDTAFKIFIGGSQVNITITDTQTNYVAFLTPSSSSMLTIYRAGSGNAGSYYIDNVKVEEVNGVAGIMTNMSEADITNDVPS